MTHWNPNCSFICFLLLFSLGFTSITELKIPILIVLVLVILMVKIVFIVLCDIREMRWIPRECCSGGFQINIKCTKTAFIRYCTFYIVICYIVRIFRLLNKFTQFGQKQDIQQNSVSPSHQGRSLSLHVHLYNSITPITHRYNTHSQLSSDTWSCLPVLHQPSTGR